MKTTQVQINKISSLKFLVEKTNNGDSQGK
jgi:hypothetical protein